MPSRILGWAPMNYNGDRVQLPQPVTKLEPYSPLPASPTNDATSSERSPSPSPEPPRRGDPDWVARPRNSFIIFRCEFARQYAGSIPTKDKRSPDDPPEKSLSKRASEAWKALPDSQKLRFQVMADLEKQQHARDNPNYRFKPVRRPSSSRRSRRSTSGGSASVGPKLRRTHIARRQRSPTPSPDQQSEYSATPASSTLALPDTAATSASDFDFALSEDDLLKAAKAAHRRSTSAPRLFNGSAALSYESASRMEFRRSKSITEGWQVPTPHQWPYDAASYPTMGNPDEFVPSDFVVTPPSPSTNLNFPAFQVSPFAAVASSLAGWNGQNLPQSSTPSWPDSYNFGQAVGSQQQADFASQSYSQPQHPNPVMNEVMDPWALPSQQPRSLYNLPNDPIQSYDPTAAALELGVNNGQYSFDQAVGTPSDEELFQTFLA